MVGNDVASTGAQTLPATTTGHGNARRYTITARDQPLPLWDLRPKPADPSSIDARTGDPPAAPPLLFIHGWGLAPPAYATMLESLARNRRVVAPYMPGLTWNHPVRRYSCHAELAAVVLSAADALELDRFHLAGQSTGGGIAAALAADHPERVLSLTLIDASGLPQHAARYPALARAREVIEETAKLGPTMASLIMTRSFLASLGWGGIATMRMTAVPLREDLTKTFQRITAPTLVLWGGRDRLFSIAAGYEMARLIPSARFHEVRDGWHSWEVNRGAEAARLIEQHIDRTTAPSIAQR